jgi:hypothetical protein
MHLEELTKITTVPDRFTSVLSPHCWPRTLLRGGVQSNYQSFWTEILQENQKKIKKKIRN